MAQGRQGWGYTNRCGTCDMLWIGGLTNPASYIYTHIQYLAFGSPSNVLSSKSNSKFNPHPYVQLGPSYVILPPLAPNPYIPTIMS
ncbi:hypothetical protein L211DRAFT_649367 [Terfezia boudieri ATCC MYA-4762]|uniref:Uncharacterized protein n=1 Tax=Terfezia boudieri ATCC MYA-4762 TaxID=1051890 RepID=A0A3N4LUY3_9PEZI|nr:hypothetical protein L211DRAFT_649367 [Terfezia boudieri ATCC MYA-4762]